MRNGTESFSASAADNPTGRNNNKGFEGMAINGDGKTLWLLLQSAANQDGGLKNPTRRHSRLVKYDITVPSTPRYAREFVVPLPFVPPANNKVAAQSEFFHIQ